MNFAGGAARFPASTAARSRIINEAVTEVAQGDEKGAGNPSSLGCVFAWIYQPSEMEAATKKLPWAPSANGHAAMNETHLAAVNDYEGLQRAMRARAEALGISRETLTAISGLESGHVNKLLADPPTKNMGVVSFGILMQALGLKLLVVEDQEQMSKIADRLVPRNGNNGAVLAITKQPTIEIRISRQSLKKRQIAGGKARAQKLSPRRRVQIARMGGLARWA